MSTADNKYLYNTYYEGKKLDDWISLIHRENSINNRWKTYMLKPYTYGYDCMAYTIASFFEYKNKNENWQNMNIDQLARILHQFWTEIYIYWRDNQPWKKKNSPYKKPTHTLEDSRRMLLSMTKYEDLEEEEKEKSIVLARIFETYFFNIM